MTLYYVSTSGDNTENGETPTTAWRTINYALTQMVAYDVLNITAGAYEENVVVSTDHTTLTGAGSAVVTIDMLEIYGSYSTCSGFTVHAMHDNTSITNLTLDDIVTVTCSTFGGLVGANISNCDFSGIVLHMYANAAAFVNNTFRTVNGLAITIANTGVTGITFDNTTILGDSPPAGSGIIGLYAGSGIIFTNTLFESPERAIHVNEYTAGDVEATFIQDNRKVFVGTAGTTTVSGANSTLVVVADGTYDYRDFVVTPDVSIEIPETTLWETTGNKNKAWKVTATGSRTVTFQLGDMLASTRYNLLADDQKVATAVSDSSGVISFDYTGSFSEKIFTTTLATPTHDLIRTAAITTLQADATLNAAIKTWLKYLIDTGKITYPAIYIGTIIQPLDGSCGTDTQHTSIADPMKITVGVLSNTHAAASTELGTLYELVYNAFKATPELGLSNFRIHHISPIVTKPIPKCGRSIIRAEMTLNATLEE